MTDYNRRFTKNEFRDELFKHLRDAPKDVVSDEGKLRQHAAIKANRYDKALKSLDAAMDRVRKMADSAGDDSAKQEAEAAIKEINDAINAYGEAAMSFNSKWEPIWNAES